MASEKKQDSIGSSEELDEYGVWVKSEPQDLSLFPEDLSGPGEDSLESAENSDFADFSGFEVMRGEGEESPVMAENLEPGDLKGKDSSGDAEAGDFKVEDINWDDLEDGFGPEDFTIEEAGEETDSGIQIEEDLGLPDLNLSIVESADVSPAEEPVLPEVEKAPAEPEITETDDVTLEAKVEVEAPPAAATAETGSAEKPPETRPQAGAAPDLSTQLLMRIAEELASIRTELTSLKQEFSGFRGTDAAPPPAAEEKDGGFFSKEDDEKIALTGDELDNILSAAAFTEEAGAGAAGAPLPDTAAGEPEAAAPAAEETPEPEESAGALQEEPGTEAEIPPESPAEGPAAEEISLEESPAEEPAAEEILLEESPAEEPAAEEILLEESSAEEPAAEEISLEESPVEEPAAEEISLEESPPEEPAAEEISLEESPAETAEEEFVLEDLVINEEEPDQGQAEETDELHRIIEEGALPLTPALPPEDTSYLEEDPIAPHAVDEAGIEDFDAANPFEDEASLDLSGAVIEETDLVEESRENPLRETSLDDISIDLDLEEERFLDNGEEISLSAEEDISLEEPSFPIEDEAEAEEPAPEDTSPEFAEEDSGGDIQDMDDLALIPEGFVVESEEYVPPEEDMSAETADFAPPQVEEEPEAPEPESPVLPPAAPVKEEREAIPDHLKKELKTVLAYMDKLLESLPDEKIEEFARSDYFDTYKKLFKELGLAS